MFDKEILVNAGCSPEVIAHSLTVSMVALSIAERLGLPGKDYIPLTPEEKIVSYADNLISGVAEVPFSEALDRFKIILGPDHEGVCRFIRQHEEIQGWMK